MGIRNGNPFIYKVEMMGGKRHSSLVGLLSVVATLVVVTLLSGGMHASPMSSVASGNIVLSRSARASKSPSVPTAPLDVDDNLHHTMDELSTILGVLGGASSSAVMGLTGVSITDCALSIKEEDLATITCSQFLDRLSECDSMQHLKPLIQQAKQKYRKKSHSRAPCFARKAKKHSG